MGIRKRKKRIILPLEEKAGLRHGYLSVEKGGRNSFGGNQNWFGGMLEKCGCGIISAADLLWYLEKKANAESSGKLGFEEYEQYVRKLRRSFLLIPYHGMPGFVMAACLDHYLKKRKLGYRAYWGTLPGKFQTTIREMLENDIPVPFCVGPCLTQAFAKKGTRGLKLYEKRTGDDGSEQLVWTKTVHSHFMTMTGIEGDWVRVSSWGEEYYISMKELEAFVKKDGLGLFTNIISVRKIRPKRQYITL